MQTSEGIWYPKGGIQAVPKALTRLIQELGVDIRTGTGIRQIYMEGGRAAGVVTEAGERVPLSAIVSDADSVRTHRELLEAEPKARAEDRSLLHHEMRKRNHPILPWQAHGVSRPIGV
jgi:phytoene dehydrogenase-like protein